MLKLTFLIFITLILTSNVWAGYSIFEQQKVLIRPTEQVTEQVGGSSSSGIGPPFVVEIKKAAVTTPLIVSQSLIVGKKFIFQRNHEVKVWDPFVVANTPLANCNSSTKQIQCQLYEINKTRVRIYKEYVQSNFDSKFEDVIMFRNYQNSTTNVSVKFESYNLGYALPLTIPKISKLNIIYTDFLFDNSSEGVKIKLPLFLALLFIIARWGGFILRKIGLAVTDAIGITKPENEWEEED